PGRPSAALEPCAAGARRQELLTHQSGSQRTNRPRPRLGRAGEADRLNHRRGGFSPAASFDYSRSQHAPRPTKLRPRATSRDVRQPLITSTGVSAADFFKTPVWHVDAARGPSTPSFDHLVGSASSVGGTVRPSAFAVLRLRPAHNTVSPTYSYPHAGEKRR